MERVQALSTVQECMVYVQRDGLLFLDSSGGPALRGAKATDS